MAEQKVYLKCSAKARTFDNGGTVIKLGIKVEDLAEFCRQHKNERGYLNLVVAERREQGQYGDTHSVFLDTYTPRTGAGAMDDHAKFSGRHSTPVTADDIPF